MKTMLRWLLFVLCVFTLPTTVVAEQAREMNWEDLAGPIPEDVQTELDAISEVNLMDVVDIDELDAKWEALQKRAYPVVQALDGKRIRIPGFVVPIDLEANIVKEFLLVPYLGACIHVPPPPPNQVIYVKSPKEYTVEELFDPVWVTGRIEIANISTDLAESGYVLHADEVVRYVEQ